LGLLDLGQNQFVRTFLTDGSPTAFGSIIEFILPANGGSAYGVLNLPLSFPGVLDFNVNFSSMGLYTYGTDTVINANDVRVAFTSGTNVSELSFNFPSTPPNTKMYLLINGFVTGNAGPGGLSGGQYSGAISVSPVPEPEVWAMMLVGAGLVGFQLRRKSKQAATQRFV